MKQYIILRVVAKIVIPIIMLFALYVQFHGDFGPGGGFQAGVIFASAIVLYCLIYGIDKAAQVITPDALKWLASTGVLLYGGVGVLNLLAGGNFLEYNVIHNDPKVGQHLGIFLVELGVGITVTSVMLIIFFTFAGRNK